MTTHARLRQVADRALAAFSEVDLYQRVLGPDHVEDHAEKVERAEGEWETAKAELLAVLP